jgi:hypothetical protein
MRLLPFMFGIICIGIIGISTPAGAAVQNNPWWAIYSDGVVGRITNCALCMETARGLGAFCRLNPQYRSLS